MVKQIKTNNEIDENAIMSIDINFCIVNCGCFGMNCSCFRVF